MAKTRSCHTPNRERSSTCSLRATCAVRAPPLQPAAVSPLARLEPAPSWLYPCPLLSLLLPSPSESSVSGPSGVRTSADAPQPEMPSYGLHWTSYLEPACNPVSE
jgi:hypothetical protein